MDTEEQKPTKRPYNTHEDSANPFALIGFDIVRTIIGFLFDPTDLISVTRVCKLFNKVCNDPLLWEHVVFPFNTINKAYISYAISIHGHQMITLDLSGSSYSLAYNLAAIFAKCKNLQRLSIRDCKSSETIVQYLPVLHHLEILNVCGFYIDLSILAKASPNLKQLFTANSSLDHESVKVLTNPKYWQHLETLDIRNTGCDQKKIMKIIEAHSKIHTIFVSVPIKAPHIRVVLDNAKTLDDIVAQLKHNSEFISNIDVMNSKSKSTLLLSACITGAHEHSFPLVKALLDLGANPNHRMKIFRIAQRFDPWKPCYPNPHSNWGVNMVSPNLAEHSAIIFAVEGDHLELLELLLKSGGNLNFDWFSSVNTITQPDRKITLEKLISLGAIVTSDAVSSVVMQNNLEAFKVLLDRGIDVNYIDGGLSILLRSLLINGINEISKLLIQHGATVAVMGCESYCLFEAVTCVRSLPGFIKAVELGFPLLSKDEEGNNVLHIASVHHIPDIALPLVEFILKTEHKDVLLNDKNNKGRPPLIYYIVESMETDFKEEIVDVMLNAGADINIQDSDGKTALLHACLNNDKEIVYFLLNRKANVNIADKNGLTPLHDSFKLFEELLKHGAYINSQDKQGVTPVMSYLKRCVDEEDFEDIDTIIELATKAGADFTLQDFYEGNTFLHLVSALEEHIELSLETLVKKHNLDVNVRNFYNDTPLHVIAEEECVAAAKSLLELGANPDICGRNGQTPLLIALNRFFITDCPIYFAKDMFWPIKIQEPKSGYRYPSWLATNKSRLEVVNSTTLEYLSMIKTLLPVSNVNIADNRGFSPLHYLAAMCYDSKSFEKRGQISNLMGKVLERGANVNAQDYIGDTPLHKLLKVAKAAAKTPLLEKIYYQRLCMLLDKGADLNITNNNGFTAIHDAFSVNVEVMKTMLFHKGTNIHIVDQTGNNYLHYLVETQVDFSTLQMLLRNGVNVNQQNVAGNTPLHVAIRNEMYMSACEIAMNPLTDVNIRNKSGQTALHLAVGNWRAERNTIYSQYPYQVNELAIILIKRKGDLTIKDKFGKTPLDLASSEHKKQLLSVTLEEPPVFKLTEDKMKEEQKRHNILWSDKRITETEELDFNSDEVDDSDDE